MVQLAPSLLAADFNHLKRQLILLEEEGIEVVHLDLMDGKFVPNISFGMALIKSIRPSTKMKFDVHMMVEEPKTLVKAVQEAGADRITVHYEACQDLIGTLDLIKAYQLEVGVALKSETPITVIETLLPLVDVIQIMSVLPGLGGQTFIPETLERIRNLKEYITRNSLNTKIEVDGDIHLGNLPAVLQAGADIIVSGTALFRGDLSQNIRTFQQIINTYTESISAVTEGG